MFPNRYSPIGLATIPIFWLARLFGRGRLTVRTPMDIAILLLLVMSLVSLYPSVSLYLSWPKLMGILLGIVLFYAIVNNVTTERAVWYAAAALCLGGLSVALISLVGTDWSNAKLLYLPQANDYLPRMVHLLPKSVLPAARDGFNPNEVGGALALLLPVPAALMMSRLTAIHRTGISVVLAVMLGTLTLSQSRSAIFGLSVAILILTIWNYRKAVLLVPILVAGLALVTSVSGGESLRNMLLSIEGTSGMASLRPEDRIQLWWTAAQMIQDFPITGIGLNTFPLVMDNMYPVFSGFYRMTHAHNLFLQTAVDLGILGLLALLWLLVAFGVSVVRATGSPGDKRLQGLARGLGCGVIAYLLYGLTDAFTLGAKPGVFFWAMLGLAVSLGRLKLPEVERSSREFRCDALAGAHV